MLRGLFALSDRTPKKTRDLGLDSGARSDFTTLRYWGLICKEEKNKWMLTGKGHQFIHGEISVPKYLFIFNSQVEGQSEERITIHEIDDKLFDKEEFMEHASPYDDYDKGGQL